jgi:hypothetical protein
VNTRTNAELQGVFTTRRQQHAAEAAERREELGRAAAPLIAQTLPPHTGWLTIDDVGVFAGIEREEADAGCDVLAASDILQRATVYVERVQQPVPIVRRTAAGTLDSAPLRAWLEAVVAERFSDDVAEAAACLETSEEFLWRVLEDTCDRVLLQAADWLFVRAGEPHQLQLLYPADDDAVEPADGATA